MGYDIYSALRDTNVRGNVGAGEECNFATENCVRTTVPKDQHSVTSFWVEPFRLAGSSNFDAGRCRWVVNHCRSVAELLEYLEKVLGRLRVDGSSGVEEAWTVAIPLAYRLSVDDTSHGYRIGAALKDAALRASHPRLMECIDLEMDWMCKSAYNVRYSELQSVHETIADQLSDCRNELEGQWRVYGRIKSIGSTFEKLARYYTGQKRPKADPRASLVPLPVFLDQFAEQVSERLMGNHRGKQGYSGSDVRRVLPDLLAFTLQLKESARERRNLGSAKARYKGVFRCLEACLPGEAYFGPAYSSAWHMNRMVCHWGFPVNDRAIGLELFVRTDFDFFVGYGSYWRYKGIDLFSSAADDRCAARKRFVSNLRTCGSFRDVQELLLREINSGQLTLF
jgi:hypothetical protein